MDAHQHIIDGAPRALGHATGASALLAAIAGVMPIIASFAAAVWYGFVIYESRTMQQFIRKRWPSLALDVPPKEPLHEV